MAGRRGACWLAIGLLSIGLVAHADERTAFLQQQYQTQCLEFAAAPDKVRERLQTSQLTEVPAVQLRQLLLGSDGSRGWLLPYRGRQEYILVLAEGNSRCAILARHVDVEQTLNLFERLINRPPDSYRSRPLALTEADLRYAGDAEIRRGAWQGAEHTLVHELLISTRKNAPIQAILALTLTTKIEQ
ncbi:NMCC_0638 family (lipo)protein [Marinobacterium marinum]|uniref:Uncharacterized protein n=1 Tax=Marinobacterium marinum TaxID=2756129 RepID=A0A7W1WVE8_9GAMM|nr:hypothetical protein [Marinobacterium marinum]MBA4500956.1 hypothetical protein [Marinobacterium marinum]